MWDYPRPPRVEPSTEHVVVELGGRTVADTRRAVRVLETSQAPGYYLPPEDVDLDLLVPSARRSTCEWKGVAHYWSVRVGDLLAADAVWGYPDPRPGFEAIAGHLAFYPQHMDACRVDGELVQANDGDFYGGWITSKVVGPFKGAPGTWGW